VLARRRIGPEVSRAQPPFCANRPRVYHEFEFRELPIGGAAIDACGTPLRTKRSMLAEKADAVFLGAVGGPKWDSLPLGKRPKAGCSACGRPGTILSRSSRQAP